MRAGGTLLTTAGGTLLTMGLTTCWSERRTNLLKHEAKAQRPHDKNLLFHPPAGIRVTKKKLGPVALLRSKSIEVRVRTIHQLIPVRLMTED